MAQTGDEFHTPTGEIVSAGVDRQRGAASEVVKNLGHPPGAIDHGTFTISDGEVDLLSAHPGPGRP